MKRKINLEKVKEHYHRTNWKNAHEIQLIMLEDLQGAIEHILNDYKDTILYYRTHVDPEIIEE